MAYHAERCPAGTMSVGGSDTAPEYRPAHQEGDSNDKRLPATHRGSRLAFVGQASPSAQTNAAAQGIPAAEPKARPISHPAVQRRRREFHGGDESRITARRSRWPHGSDPRRQSRHVRLCERHSSLQRDESS